jgi:hypothetical protein
MVGQGQANKEGGQQEVTVLPALSPEKEGEQGEGDKQGIEGIDLCDDGLGPEQERVVWRRGRGWRDFCSW